MEQKRNLILTGVLIVVLATILFAANEYVYGILPADVTKTILLFGASAFVVAAFLGSVADASSIIERIRRSRTRVDYHRTPGKGTHGRVAGRLQRNRDIMLKKIRYDWIQGGLEYSLHGAVLLHLGLEYRPDMVHPWDMELRRPHCADSMIPEGSPMISVCDALGGSFLILGEPGSGKTTALLELTRDLLDRAEADDDAPIPTVFNLSTWTTNRDDIEQWLVTELNVQYQVPIEIGTIWVEDDALLLLLDGLDEVKDPYGDACVTAINEFRSRHGVSIVVCSRTLDYEALNERLQLPGAVVQKPLTPAQIDQYLESLGESLKPVNCAIHVDRLLMDLAQTPLHLSIIALAYRGMPFEDLLIPGTAKERENHLFETYIDRMFSEHRKSTLHYDPYGHETDPRLARRLWWLARLMNHGSQVRFHIEGLQPEALTKTAYRRAYAAVLAILLAIVVFGSSALSFGFALKSVTHSPASGAISGAFFGLTSSMGMWIVFSGSYSIFYRAMLGVFVGSAMVLVVRSFLDNPIICLLVGLPVAVMTTIAYKSLGKDPSGWSPSSGLLSISTSRKSVEWSWQAGWEGLVKRLPLGIPFGLAGGVAVGVSFGPILGIVVGTGFVLAVGVVGAMARGWIYGNIDPLTRPNEAIWRSLENAVRFGAAGGLWVGLILGSLIGLMTDVFTGLLAGALFAVAVFVLGALTAGGFTVVQHCILRVFLYYCEDVPLRYPPTLDHAIYHIFLKRVGGGYMFYHGLLRDRFERDGLRLANRLERIWAVGKHNC